MGTSYDVIVVGGGPSGAVAASLLARAGWRVAIIEKAVFPRRKVCGEFISATTWPLLRAIGVVEPLLSRAGPPVRRVGMYAGNVVVIAPLTAPQAVSADCGRAIGREHLDSALLEGAARAGVELWQPWELTRFGAENGSFECGVTAANTRASRNLIAPLVIAAHGSWERGVMPTQASHPPAGAGDLFGFKAHFEHAGLDDDLMPLLSFPGGYGGMVNSDAGRLSLSFCIRRDALALCRRLTPSSSAGNAALTHIQASCRGVAQTLSNARRLGPWLAAGPLRTGLRGFGDGGCYTVGNATAEAHPIVAEGLSMAMQSAGLLCDALLRGEGQGSVWSRTRLDQVRSAYAAAWHQHFAQRLNLAAFAAHVFMRPASARLAALTLQGLPSLLSRAALWSGKAQIYGLDLGALGAWR